LKNKCCLYVIISIRFFSITICNLLIELPSYFFSKSITVSIVTRTLSLLIQTLRVLLERRLNICNSEKQFTNYFKLTPPAHLTLDFFYTASTQRASQRKHPRTFLQWVKMFASTVCNLNVTVLMVCSYLPKPIFLVYLTCICLRFRLFSMTLEI
jgi:hypothetical protein